MNTYTEKELEAIEKAEKILIKAGLYVEKEEEMPDPDGLQRWCIHSKEE